MRQSSEAPILKLSIMLFNRTMKTISEIRLQNLELLITEVGTAEQLAEQCDLSAIYLSQIKNRAIDVKTSKPRNLGSQAARKLEKGTGKPQGWMDREHIDQDQDVVIVKKRNEPIEGYIRLEHLPYQPSMGTGLAHDGDTIVQHMDVLETFVKQKIGTTNPNRIKLLTGIGQSMMPTIQDQDIVFVDVEQRWIDAPGIYVIDVGGLLLLKKALILSSGTLVLRSDNTEEYPDEEKFDLAKVGDSITVCGKVLAWWTLRKG